MSPLVRGSDIWVLPPGMEVRPPALLEALVERSNVGLNCVVSLWRAILVEIESEARAKPQTSLSAVFLGGEPLTPNVIEKSLEILPGLRIWNLYGPAEATATATFTRLRRGDAVSIGRPVANVQNYVLDNHLNPVPVGIPGELHIGGDGLAVGYLNRPELTAEKFIANPFSDEPGARLYKTGDLARYLPDGNIEFLGRMDDQVKIRGNRIELGEIEAVLAKHPAVQAVVTVAHEDEKSEKRLVSYVVSGSEPRPRTHELRAFLKTKLPQYMLPARFVFLEALPLTPNGKVDRRALPAPELSRSDSKEGFVAPRTETEALVAQAWQQVLGLERVSVHDNFFDLGGHSLLTIQVIAKLERRTGLRISPSEMVIQNLGQLAAVYEEWMKSHPQPKAAGSVGEFWRKVWNTFGGAKR